MAQRRFHQWEDDDLTRLMNQKFIGLIEPGPYRGFNAAPFDGTVNLTLRHGTDWYGDNGATESTYAESPGSESQIGVIFTKQGVVIKETGAIVLPIAPNGSANPRIDRIVCRSVYTEVPGGDLATYAVYTGTPAANPAPPSISFPNEEIILGELRVPGFFDAMDNDGVIWTRTTPPPFAQQLFTMYTNKLQTSTEMKTFEEIGLVRSSGVINGLDTMEVDVQDPSTLQWDEANGTLLSINVVAETEYIFTNIKTRFPNNRILLLTFTGSGAANSVLKLHFNNFLTPTPQRNPPWNSDNVSRKHLRVYEGDVVAIIGENSLGTLWRVLWHHSGKTVRSDRRVTLEHSLLLNRGETILDSEPEVYFDWTANIVELPTSGNFTLNSLKPTDGTVQEADIPPGYVLHVLPRYTGSTIHDHKFILAPGGNIVTTNDFTGTGKGMIVPWNRLLTFISVPSPNGGSDAKWMLKDWMAGEMMKLTTYRDDATNIQIMDGGSGDVAFYSGPNGDNIWVSYDGQVCEVSCLFTVIFTGTVTSFGLKAPHGCTVIGTDASNVLKIAGVGNQAGAPVVAYYGGNNGNFISIVKYDGSAFTNGPLRIRMRFEVFPSY